MWKELEAGYRPVASTACGWPSSATTRGRWTHSDHLHSATVITDASGAEVRRLAYAAFGAQVENVGTGDAPTYTYTAKEADASGLMYYGARYYDPALARFITADTVYDVGSQGLNRYSYTLNNPMIYRDPTGHGVVSDFLYGGWGSNLADKIDAGVAAATEMNLDVVDADPGIGTTLAASGYNTVIQTVGGSVSGVLRIGQGTGEYIADPTDYNKIPVVGPAGKGLGKSYGEAIVDPSVETISRAIGETARAVGIALGGVQFARMLGVPGTKGNPLVREASAAELPDEPLRTPRPTDRITMQVEDALDEAESFLGNYDDKLGGFVSEDGTRRVRMTNDDLATVNNHAGAPHLNFEEGSVATKWDGKETFIPDPERNSHVYINE